MVPSWREGEEKTQLVVSQKLCPQMVFLHTAHLCTNRGLLKATLSHFGYSGILAIPTEILDTCKHPSVHTSSYSFSAELQRAGTDPQSINQVMVCLSLCHEEFSENPAVKGRKLAAETHSRAGAWATGKQLQREILELLSWDLCCWNASQIFHSQQEVGKKDRVAWDSLYTQGCLSSGFGGIKL